MAPEFQAWLAEVDSLARADGFPGSYTEQTGPEPWLDAYGDDMTPADAWAEERSAAAECHDPAAT